jgi:hypothetical protein
MNKILTISAIALVAVVMGMSAFAPAMADKPDGTHSNVVAICHDGLDGDETVWVNQKGADAHLANHDDYSGECIV